MLFYNPLNMSFIEAQLGGTPFASLMGFVNAQWVSYARTGLGTQIVEGRKYKVRVTALGSSVSIWVDSVQVLATTLESFGPGVIIQDIERQISEAQVVIADITPANSNVYYEVGYAHALQKPTILLRKKQRTSHSTFRHSVSCSMRIRSPVKERWRRGSRITSRRSFNRRERRRKDELHTAMTQCGLLGIDRSTLGNSDDVVFFEH